MAKRVDPLKAKQAKQKKMAIGLCVFLVAVLAYQVPKTLKLMKGPQAATTTAAPAPVGDPIATSVATPTGGAPAVGVPVTGAAQPAVLVDSDVPADAGDGQLRSFELFQAKDPFAQQNGGITAVKSSSPAPSQESTSRATETTSTRGGSVIAPAPSASNAGGTAPPPPAATSPGVPTAAAAGTTSISVNNVAEDVAVEGTFPAAAPVFVLVSLADDGKSVQIGVAGGVYANGAKTIKLKLGKSLTLQNTADGTRYELKLLTVAGFIPPKPGK